MDALAGLLDGVRARTAAFCRVILDPPWALRIADKAPLSLATTLHGHAWTCLDGAEPVLMRTGDVVIVKGPDPYTVGDDPATRPAAIVRAGNRLTTLDGVDITDDPGPTLRTSGPVRPDSAVVASGTYQVTGDVGGRLLNALPDVLHVPYADARSPVLDLLATEVARDAPGQQVVLDRLLDLVLITTLRAWFARGEADAPGWYRAHSDPLVGTAMRLIHDNPALPWTVASLAAKAGASRAGLARRFTDLVGEPPMTYLTNWRITLAADLLRKSDATVESVAHQVGYANAFAFTVAFKRVRGTTPRQHRTAAFTASRPGA